MNITNLILFSLFVICFLLFVNCYSQTYSRIDYNAGTNMEIETGADICADSIIINGTYSGGGTICQGALPVIISSFTFSTVKNNVKLMWTTETELNNSGFNVERKALIGAHEGWVRIAFVPGGGTTNQPKEYFFEDKKLKTGEYQYRLKQIDFNGNYEYFQLENDVIVAPPDKFSLSQNYPNPSNPKSKIDYELPQNLKVTIKIYDIIGREVMTLVDNEQEAGYYIIEFDGSNLASGVYFYRITVRQAGSSTSNFTAIKKIVLIK